MKVFISADIEGVGGVATWDQAGTKRPDHERARQWMTEEVNCAVEGALEGGATEVVVRDAHGSARNILWDSLHPQARLISGWGPNIDMLLGIDESFGTAFLIGYHPGASAKRGVLSHAYTSRILDLRLNDLPCNEGVIGAIAAGTAGVPVGLVSGQAELWEEIRHTLPHCEFVVTKHGYFWQAALLEPMPEVRNRIRGGAKKAVASAIAGNGPQPFRPDPPLRLAMALSTIEAAAAIEGVDGVERVSAGECQLVDEDGGSLIRRFLTVLKILYAVRDRP